jgi:hypothetical protein
MLYCAYSETGLEFEMSAETSSQANAFWVAPSREARFQPLPDEGEADSEVSAGMLVLSGCVGIAVCVRTGGAR